MADQALLLAEFRKSYERLEAVRAQAKTAQDVEALKHAEKNFHACAESLARLLPKTADAGWSPSGRRSDRAFQRKLNCHWR